MKKLSDIINCEYDNLIKDIKTDSREVEKDDLFVAVNGFNVDHSLYIDDAIKNKAAAIITDKDYKANIPVIKVNDINKTLIDACKKNYDYKNNINLIGITGTDGKTTTATMIKRLLEKTSKTAYIGTNGLEYEEYIEKLDNTTPQVEKIYKYLKILQDREFKNLAIEVSSEALLHKRVDSFKFKYVIYTNITEDHLNIHKTIENYINTKIRLTQLIDNNGIIIINSDDPNQNIIKDNYNNIYTYGKNNESDFLIKNIKYKKNKTYFSIKHNNEEYNIESPFIGEYNIYNLTAAFVVAYLENIPVKDIITEIKNMSKILGRGENLKFGQNYTIILDYAHTENGIKNIVNSLKDKYKKVTVVTGAAGGREKEKRSKIGKFLLENVDFVIFTMDDPRYESVDSIIDDMLKETKKDNYIRIISRKKAIKYALENANEDELLLILGKGRDNYMAIENRKERYSDYEEIEKFF